jgi:hypothetical protein
MQMKRRDITGSVDSLENGSLFLLPTMNIRGY